MPLLCPCFGPQAGNDVKEEDRLRAELAETKAKLAEAEARLNTLATDMKARLDQIAVGRRTEFEAALIKAMRDLMNAKKEPIWSALSFILEENPALTPERAITIVNHFELITGHWRASIEMRTLYYKMRGALEEMLLRLPNEDEVKKIQDRYTMNILRDPPERR
jgi:hypothetical protein